MPNTLAITDSSARPADAGVDEITERFDPIACLDDRFRLRGKSDEPVEPGRYIQIQGPGRTLLIQLGAEVTHIGRGLAADLHLDDISVLRYLECRPDGNG